MPRDMFTDVVDPSIKMGSKAWYTVPLTMALEATIVGALVIVPLMAADVLPTPPSMMAFVAAARRRHHRHRRHRRHRRTRPSLPSK